MKTDTKASKVCLKFLLNINICIRLLCIGFYPSTGISEWAEISGI